MEGIAKSATPQQAIQAPIHSTPDSFMQNSIDGVPIGIYMYYDKSFGGETSVIQSQLKTIYEYAKSISPSPADGDVMMTLRDIDRRMGTPKIGESRLGRAFNYAKITGIINNLERQRQALTGD